MKNVYFIVMGGYKREGRWDVCLFYYHRIVHSISRSGSDRKEKKREKTIHFFGSLRETSDINHKGE